MDSLSSVHHALAGGVAGAVSTALAHPFDLVKIRFQVDDSTARSLRWNRTFATFAEIYRKGGFLALYQGASANFLAAATSWGLFFFIYEHQKKQISWLTSESKWKSSTIDNMLASWSSGIIVASITNPLWTVKTRLCTQNVQAPDAYRGIFDAFTKITQAEGIRGLYRGYVFGLINTTHGAIQMVVYEAGKKWMLNRTKKAHVDSHEAWVVGAVAKTAAVIFLYPFQLARTRMQNQRGDVDAKDAKYNHAFKTMMRIARNEGLRGFYKGLAPSLMRTVPAGATTFAVYEGMLHIFRWTSLPTSSSPS